MVWMAPAAGVALRHSWDVIVPSTGGAIQVHGVDADGQVSAETPTPAKPVPRILRRACDLSDRHGGLFGRPSPGSPTYRMGHEVRLMPPSYEKPCVKRNKTDAADTAAVCEALTRPSMRTVPRDVVHRASRSTTPTG